MLGLVIFGLPHFDLPQILVLKFINQGQAETASGLKRVFKQQVVADLHENIPNLAGRPLDAQRLTFLKLNLQLGQRCPHVSGYPLEVEQPEGLVIEINKGPKLAVFNQRGQELHHELLSLGTLHFLESFINWLKKCIANTIIISEAAMQDREARKKFRELELYIENPGNLEVISKCQQQLEREFDKLNQVITDYTVKKEENDKRYTQELQSHIQGLFQETVNQIGRLDALVEERESHWPRLKHKMQIFNVLRQNIRQMLNLNKSGRLQVNE